MVMTQPGFKPWARNQKTDTQPTWPSHRPIEDEMRENKQEREIVWMPYGPQKSEQEI